MAGKISNSFALVKASGRVLMADKELLVFPLISGVTSLLVAATFFVPTFMLGWFESMAEGGSRGLGYALMFLFYLAQYTVIFFFNTALVGAALIRLEGGDPTVKDGLRIAFDRLGVIVEYAALAATVGMILRFLSERAGFIGRIVIGLVGMAWTLATFMVVPVLVTRNVGPLDAVKESAGLFRRTWGEQVVGGAGMGLVTFLAFCSLALFAFPALVLAAPLGPAALIVVGALFASGAIFLALAASALNGIYAAALYRYATTGEAGYGFDTRLLAQAFVQKRR